ncbi:hypothetical protein SO802_021389 [Lithocarpus litseifolius]|uniref:CCHC-type domain-containing protein n=1 Tax=Lithocarpus litseifolius TaxID=425828 RepID=A0AAW2CG67_9ROSI
MAPPRRSTRNGQSNARGTTNLQAIIKAIGGVTNIVQHQVEVVDRALIAERNCNHLSKANDQEREPNQINFLKGKPSESSFKKSVFKCGKTGHFIKDCPALKSELMTKPSDVYQRPKIQGRVFAITRQDVEESKSGTISLFSLIK